VICVIATLFVALYHPNLTRLWLKTNPINGEGNFEHAIFVPLVGAYFLFTRRDELLRTRYSPLLGGAFTRSRLVSGLIAMAVAVAGYFAAPALLPMTLVGYVQPLMYVVGGAGLLALALDWGLASLLVGLAVSGYGIWPGQNDFVWDFGMVLTLFGAVLTIGGWPLMRVAWFPIAFLVVAIPWPPLLYSKIALPLQQLAAHVAVVVLQIIGVDAQYEGTKILIADRAPLNVAEACAGLKSLMTFVFLSAAMAFLSARPMWQRFFIVAMAIPIAIFCNVMRVTGQGIAAAAGWEAAAQGITHQMFGLAMLIPAFFLVLGTMWLLDFIFEPVDDEPEGDTAAAKSRGGDDGVISLRKPKTGAARPAAATVAPVSNEPIESAPRRRLRASASSAATPSTGDQR
jgi:exosortase